MPSHSLRVLATLAALAAVMLVETDGRPLPQPSPHFARRVSLLSTSPTPPLPIILQPRQTDQVKRLSHSGETRPVPVILKTALPVDKRDNVDSHIHSHVHEHLHGKQHDDYAYSYDSHGRHHPNTYAQEEIDRHSKHWAEHHGLLHDGHPYHDGDEHIHQHIHDHVHEVAERSLVADLVKPLLAPLNILPGFITISNLLFGDGISDSGLLKRLGGLVLHVEAGNATKAHDVYTFSLMASKRERTQVYLAPVAGNEARNDSVVVKVTLPLLNAAGSPLLMCASVPLTPPSELTLEACSDGETSQPPSSQIFTYTPSTGELAPILNATDNTSTAGVTARDAPSDSTTSTRVFMHFDPVAPAASVEKDAGGDEANSAVSTAVSDASVTEAAAPTTTDGADRRNKVPVAVRLSREQASGTEEVSDETLDDAPSDTAIGSDAGLAQDLDGPLSSEASDDSDEVSRIFMANGGVGGESVANIPKQATQWDLTGQANVAHCPCFAEK